MALPPPKCGERGGFYPVLGAMELAAEFGYTTKRRRRTVLTTCAYSSPGSGIQRGLGKGPVAWRRGGCTHCPKCASNAVVYSLKPSVRKRGTQPGANIWTT